jgi:hypothetical protein
LHAHQADHDAWRIDVAWPGRGRHPLRNRRLGVAGLAVLLGKAAMIRALSCSYSYRGLQIQFQGPRIEKAKSAVRCATIRLYWLTGFLTTFDERECFG